MTSPAFSGRTARASPPPSACCSACCAPTAGTVRLLGGDPWRDAVALHRRIAYVPGDVTLWPNLTGLQAIDFLARLRGNGSRHPTPRPADRAVRTRPAQEGAHLLEGQPAEGGDRRGVLHQRRALHPRRADLWPGPVDGEGVSDVRRGGRRPRRRGAALQSHPRRGGEALRQRHDHPRRTRGEVRHARGAAAPDAHHHHGAHPP